MTKTPIAVVIAFALLIVGAAPALASEITVKGGGWGHGIGMPQHGAKAMAESGKTGEQIIQHFYTNVGLGTVGVNVPAWVDPLWIGVAPSSSTQRFQAVGGNVTVCLNGNCLVAQPGETWTLSNVDVNTCRYFKDGVAQGQPGPCEGEMTWLPQPEVKVHFPDIPNLGRTYARGKIVFKQAPTNTSRYHLLVEIGLEEYLRGLAEMPSSWHGQALRAQAIAGRTYATYKAYVHRNLMTGTESHNVTRRNGCFCHLYANTNDQVYTGWAKESEVSGGTHWGAKWVEAVDSTAGKVATHDSEPSVAIQAYYFSSTAARTENSEDMGWNHRSYLRSVADSGPTTWTSSQQKTFTRAQLAAALDFSTVTDAEIVDTYASGSPSSVVFTGTKNGGSHTQSFTGTQLKQKLGLRSHYVTDIVGFIPNFSTFLSADFDGDGRDEVAAYGSGSWWVFDQAGGSMDGGEWATVSATGWTKVVAGDFNGNGRSDVAMFHGPTAAWWVGLSNGSKFTFQRWALFSTKTGWGPQLVGDFNGDGKDDIANYHSGAGTWWVSRSTGSGFSTSLWATFSTKTGWSPQLVGDFNGDGKDDIANYYAGNGTWWVSRSTGSSFSTSLWATFSTKTGWSPQLVGDFNGDGRDDIANYYRGNGTWWVSRSTGSGFATSLWATFSTRTGWSPQLVGDFNGDGKDDIANFHSSNGSWWVSRSTGSGFSTSLKGAVSPGSGWVAQLVGDYNGDGKDDLSNYHPGNGVWAIR